MWHIILDFRNVQPWRRTEYAIFSLFLLYTGSSQVAVAPVLTVDYAPYSIPVIKPFNSESLRGNSETH